MMAEDYDYNPFNNDNPDIERLGSLDVNRTFPLDESISNLSDSLSEIRVTIKPISVLPVKSYSTIDINSDLDPNEIGSNGE